MSHLRPATLLAIGLTLPFTAWGTSANLNLEPAAIDGQIPGQVLPEGISETLPPTCGLTSPEGVNDEMGAQTAACCWFLHNGRWYCVSC